MMGKKYKELLKKCAEYENTIKDLKFAVEVLQKENQVCENRIWLCQQLAGGPHIEDRLMSLSTYELGLWIMKKQLEDQLIYAGDGDAATCSTIRFESMEDLCKNMINLIECLTMAGNRDPKNPRKET